MWIAAALAVAFVAAAATWALAPLLARRSNRMPVPAHPTSETAVLDAVAARPDRIAYLYELRADMFLDPGKGAAWAAMLDAAAPHIGDLGAGSTDADLDAASAKMRADTAACTAVAAVRPDADPAWAGEDRDKETTSAAADVYIGAVERDTMPGSAPLVGVDGPDGATLVRRADVDQRRRGWFAAAAAAGGAVSVWMAAAGHYTGLAAVLAVLAGVALVATSVAVSWVDLDTLFLDHASWAVGTAAAWLAAAGAALAAGVPGRLAVGAACAAVVALLFEGLNLAYRRLRGQPGQGGGDTLIILGTLGVPAALLGQWTVAYASLMASLAAAIAAWLVIRARTGAGSDTPFAFGPALAAGWIIGVAGWLATSA